MTSMTDAKTTSDDGAPADTQGAPAEPSTADAEARMERLGRMLLWVGDQDVRPRSP